MSAIVCESWDLWLSWSNETDLPLLSKPSENSSQLRLTVISWIATNTITTSMFIPLAYNEPETLLISDSNSEDDLMDIDKQEDIRAMLPDGYTYKMIEVTDHKDINSFQCTFKLKIDTEEDTRKWLTDYNEKTKETMVYECCKTGKGKRVIKKFYLRCQHKQRQTGMHTKSDKALKTTHKSHNNKHTNCPAQIIVTLLAATKKSHGFCVDVILNHNHNHLLDVADALRFRKISEETKESYYDLFRLGHSPASAHLEYETNIMYSDSPQLVADRHSNPKLSDVYNLFNKWRKCNIGLRTGKQLFVELEKRVCGYEAYNQTGGKAYVQRYHKSKGEPEEPLVLAVCTPLMSRVHEHIKQSKELIFIDASSSFEDFNNPIFVISTSSAAGGLPLGVVVTSAESANVINRGMSALTELFPECSFYGNGSPMNIMIDDSSAERDALHRLWPNSNIHMCIFHFLQSVWRWLLNNRNGIDSDERQALMNLVRNLVYAKTETELTTEHTNFKQNPLVMKYNNFSSYIEGYWVRRKEWAICFRNGATMRGINTNNYAESGIRILKDIIFKRVKAYNLIQLFQFITVTFELYYQRRLLAVAFNRMDRYISLRYKGLGASKIDNGNITISSTDPNTYHVKSTFYPNKIYKIDTENWTCTCSIGRTGYPSGEPCKHQHAVANKFGLTAPNLIPYFNGDGRYLHGLIAVGLDKVGEKTFYLGMKELPSHSCTTQKETSHVQESEQSVTIEDHTTNENLTLIVDMMQEQETLEQEVITLGNKFIDDVQERVKQVDYQYLNGLKKFFTVYLDTVAKAEPTNSATPRLATLLHTYFSTPSVSSTVAGTRHMKVQPTAISRRRKGISKGSKLAASGRPPKRYIDDDPNTQTKRGRQDHVKRKQNLRQNEFKNQSNHHKHGVGH